MAKHRHPAKDHARLATGVGFSALEKLKSRLPATPQEPGGGKPAPAKAPAAKPASAARPAPTIASGGDEDAAALFRAAVGATDASPALARARNRAALERAKPAPRPIVQPTFKETDSPTPAPSRPLPADDSPDLFRALVGEVTPLKDTGRADIGHHKAPRHTLIFDRDGRKAAPGLEFGDAPLENGAPSGEAAIYDHLAASVGNDPGALFAHAVGAVAPLKDKGLADVQKPLPPPRPIKREEDERAVLAEALDSPLSFEDRLDMGIEPAFLRDGLARKVLTDLRRGRWVVQAELDLHGLTRDEAREALRRFLADSLEAGRRCLRLIHGKGLGSPNREPVLKHLSRSWLAQREEILAYCQAKPQDGGEGALLILLRAPRG